MRIVKYDAENHGYVIVELIPTISGGRERGHDLKSGIMWMSLAMLFFIGMDGSAKYLTADFTVLQVIWARFTFHLLAMAVIFLPRLRSFAQTKSHRFQVFRALTVLVTTSCVTTSIAYIPLTEAEALASTSPLFVAVLSAPFLKETVGRKRLIGIAAGFVGVLVILRPGASIMHPAAILALAAGFFFAVNQLVMRYLAFDSPLTTVFYTAVIGTVLTSIAVPFVWVAPSLQSWGVMAMMGCLSLAGQYAIVRAFAAAPAASVSPFCYTALLWAAIIGLFVFGDVPDLWTIAGVLVLVASGVSVIRSR